MKLKPYPEYKDSSSPWLGNIPVHWNLVPAFAAFKERKETNKGFSESQVLSLSYGRIIKKREDALHGLVPASFETYQIVEPGNLILRLTDLQNDQRSLRVGLVKDRGIITSAYVCISPCKPLLPAFAYYFLHAADVQKVFYSMGSGLRQSMGFVDLKRLPISIPDFEEQKQIVRFLDAHGIAVDRFIRTKRRLIELLKEQKASIINRAVMWGLDQDVPMKVSGIEWLGEIPMHWEMKRLKYIAKLQTGLTLGKNYTVEQMVNRPYLRVANVQDGYLNLSEITTISIPESQVSRYELQPGDVLMTEGGDFDKLGRGFIWEGQIEGCLHQNHVFAVRTHRRNLMPRFLALLMSSSHGKTYFTTTSKQTTNLASTNSTTIKNFLLPLPPIEEQRLIIRFVEGESSKIDSAILKAEREIDLIREYRMCLISEVVTGKFDVRVVKLTELEQVDNVALLDEETIDEAFEVAHELEMTEEGINADD